MIVFFVLKLKLTNTCSGNYTYIKFFVVHILKERGTREKEWEIWTKGKPENHRIPGHFRSKQCMSTFTMQISLLDGSPFHTAYYILKREKQNNQQHF